MIISPSILSADFVNLGSEIDKLIFGGVDWLHIDIMDGHFVPNITLGLPIVKSIRAKYDIYLDCHMMVTHPEKWVEQYASAGASCYTFHIESVKNDIESLIVKIRKNKMDVCIAIKPSTPIESIIKYVDKVDMILIMTVEPGFGGQKFMTDMISKIKYLRNYDKIIKIGVDGGINEDNISLVLDAGADVIISGSGIFNHQDYGEVIKRMRKKNDGIKHVNNVVLNNK